MPLEITDNGKFKTAAAQAIANKVGLNGEGLGKTVEVPLTKNKVAIIDTEDAERVLQYKWSAVESASGTFYARRSFYNKESQKQTTVYLHQFILNAGEDVEVDHKDRNGLNNTRENLRAATHSENQWNRTKYSNNQVGFKGVSLKKDRNNKKYLAQIKVNGKVGHIGYFYSAEEAAKAYDQKAIQLHGEFAQLNFPVTTEVK